LRGRRAELRLPMSETRPTEVRPIRSPQHPPPSHQHQMCYAQGCPKTRPALANQPDGGGSAGQSSLSSKIGVCPHGGLIVYGQRWSNGVGRRNQHADEFQDGRLSYEDMTALNHETKGPLDWNNARCQTGDRHCHHPCSFSTSYASYNRFSGDPVPGKLKQCYCVPFPEQSDLRKLRLK